jgi:hypothetical protein
VADRVFLSLWLRGYNDSNMLELWRRAIDAFPVSESAPGVSLAVYPFDWSETPVFERSFGEGTSSEELVNLASEFLHDDYAYEAELRWDLWLPEPPVKPGGTGFTPEEDSGEERGEEENPKRFTEAGWRRTPSAVSLACLGPQFAPEESGDRADIQIGFGLDAPFLPPDEDELSELDPEMDPDLADLRTRENLQQLVALVHRLDEILPVTKRLLWCETGENLAEKILEAWNLRL